MRVVNRIFTCEAAKRIERERVNTISSAEIVEELRRGSKPHRLPENTFNEGCQTVPLKYVQILLWCCMLVWPKLSNT